MKYDAVTLMTFWRWWLQHDVGNSSLNSPSAIYRFSRHIVWVFAANAHHSHRHYVRDIGGDVLAVTHKRGTGFPSLIWQSMEGL